MTVLPWMMAPLPGPLMLAPVAPRSRRTVLRFLWLLQRRLPLMRLLCLEAARNGSESRTKMTRKAGRALVLKRKGKGRLGR